MANNATVQIHRDLKARLKTMKLHPQESYNEVIWRIVEDLEDTSPAALRRYDKILKEVKAGKFKTLDQVRHEWGL